MRYLQQHVQVAQRNRKDFDTSDLTELNLNKGTIYKNFQINDGLGKFAKPKHSLKPKFKQIRYTTPKILFKGSRLSLKDQLNRWFNFTTLHFQQKTILKIKSSLIKLNIDKNHVCFSKHLRTITLINNKSISNKDDIKNIKNKNWNSLGLSCRRWFGGLFL